MSDLTEHTPEALIDVMFEARETYWDAQPTSQSGSLRGANDAVLRALGLDPSMSVAELQSLIAIGRLVMAAVVEEVSDPWYGGHPVTMGNDLYAIKTAYASGLIEWLREKEALLAAGVVEQQGAET